MKFNHVKEVKEINLKHEQELKVVKIENQKMMETKDNEFKAQV